MSLETNMDTGYVKLPTQYDVVRMKVPTPAVPEFDPWDVAERRKAVNEVRREEGRDEVILNPHEQAADYRLILGKLTTLNLAEQQQ